MTAARRHGIRVGQVYVPVDGSKNRLTVRDIETHADCEDVVVFDERQGEERRIDAFKLAGERYRLTDESTPQEREALMAKLRAGSASADEMHRAADVLRGLQLQVHELEADARRGRYAVESGEWRTLEDERDGRRTWLAVRVADKADLSCKAFRALALDQAITDPSLR